MKKGTVRRRSTFDCRPRKKPRIVFLATSLLQRPITMERRNTVTRCSLSGVRMAFACLLVLYILAATAGKWLHLLFNVYFSIILTVDECLLESRDQRRVTCRSQFYTWNSLTCRHHLFKLWVLSSGECKFFADVPPAESAPWQHSGSVILAQQTQCSDWWNEYTSFSIDPVSRASNVASQKKLVVDHTQDIDVGKHKVA